ncbi:MAG: sugar phosphate nucleotidyltransferase [Bryobacteraceae bacterium]|nr:sugar phosphate nucleotidyltransferase [Bryobacteraceae bacterium]MCX7604050.1 sugar phosphate nucleotidyltransferase [Bryobacteraceae bacterium]
MRVKKCVLTAAAPSQRRLPLQVLVDRDGEERSVLAILLEEAARAGMEEIAVVVHPGDEEEYAAVAGEHAARVRFLPQPEPRGYAHALWCAREFASGEPFLHMVGDHLYVSRDGAGCAARLVAVAQQEKCSVSAVQATREGQLTQFGAVGGQRVHGREGLYRIDAVLEKPTPTEAEQKLFVPGLRAGHYLCFFGMHVFTPLVMELLGEAVSAGGRSVTDALALLAQKERYLALEMTDRRYDLGARYGLLHAQLALALAGTDRAEILAGLVELLALQPAQAGGRG